MAANYTVRDGESIWDVSVNATGDIANVQAILDANSILTWSPVLTVGTMLNIPDIVQRNTNVLNEVKIRPIANNRPSNYNDMVAAIVELIKGSQPTDITPFMAAYNKNGDLLISDLHDDLGYDVYFNATGELIVTYTNSLDDFEFNSNGEIIYTTP